MKRSTRCVAGVAALAAMLGSGCANEVRDASAPTCTSGEDGLLLIAQSVPTADRIPCVTSYLSVWKVGAVEVRDGRSSFSFVANTKRSNGVDVTLQRECLVSGATEVPTDVPGTLRYDRIPESTSGLRMARSYTFDGASGSLTTQFNGCSVAKVVGSVLERKILVLTTDQLKYINPVTTFDTIAEVSWKRLT